MLPNQVKGISLEPDEVMVRNKKEGADDDEEEEDEVSRRSTESSDTGYTSSPSYSKNNSETRGTDRIPTVD